jgi:hypothetical protein
MPGSIWVYVVVLISAFACAGIAAFLAHQRRGNVEDAIFGGFFFGLVGIVLIAWLTARRTTHGTLCQVLDGECGPYGAGAATK